ncbi:alpha/beta hydrolase fold-3 domain protein [Niveomyces insectorum RCEF 264]|uniref:Alpha/beta hydrolase fold-3 domain protein n=1 Tax=Niveomyces insectorum RCEF 264 TaxID=1081102 RepID=A0A167SLS5_9HYPO|nr:alpha/beta hydrolase fold-3 domain protein [Niveomyces insectorum RCEF 264]
MGDNLPREEEHTGWLSRRLEYEARNQEWEDFHEKNKSQVPLLVGTVDHLRQTMFNTKMRGQGKAPPITKGLVVQDHSFSTPHGAHIKLRSYVPEKADGDESELPAMLYFHGGGFALGDLDGEDRTCRVLCVEDELVIVSVDYRLAPEHPYPAALHDSWDALDWLVEHASQFHVDLNRLLVGGSSAGANLAAVLAQGAQDHGITIQGQLLRIPVVCQSSAHYAERGLRSMLELHDTAIINPEAMHQFTQWYKPDDLTDKTVSPLLAPRLDGLPAAYFQICGRDPLRDEGLAYADALLAAGVPTRVNVYPGLPHAFWIFPEISATQTAAQDLVRGVRWLLDR